MHLEDTVWRLKGIFGSERGRLKLSGGRLSFTGEGGTHFDVPAAEIRSVDFPWYYFGGGMKLSFGHSAHRISFIQPHDDYASIRDARETGRKWKAALAASMGRI